MSLGSVFMRVALLILVFLLGFMSCIGAIFGAGYFAYKNVSLDTFSVNTDSVLNPDAEVDLSAMTIEGLVAEIQYMSTLGDKTSLNLLIDRYGLIIPEKALDYIPDAALDLPLAQAFSKEGLETLLANIYIGNLLHYDMTEGEGGVHVWLDRDSGKEVAGINGKIADYTLHQIINGDFSPDALINDITIADVLSMTADETLPVYIKSGDDKVIVEDKVIAIWYNSDGSVSEGVVGALAGYTVTEVSKEINNLELASISNMVEYNGEYYSYAVKSEGDLDYILLTEGEGIVSELADLSITDLSNGGIDDKIGDIKIASVLNYKYDEENGVWMNGESEVTGICAAIADFKVSEIDTKINELTIAEIGGYTQGEDGTWYSTYIEEGHPENVEADALMSAFVELTVDEMIHGGFDDEIQDLEVSAILGYEKNEEDGKWYHNGEVVTGVCAAIAEFKISELDTGINTVTVAELTGYTQGEDGTWYSTYIEEGHPENVKADGIMASLADLTVEQISDGAVTDRVKDLEVSTLMGYTYNEEEDKWYNNEQEVTGICAVIADYKIDELDTKVNEITMGELSGYTLGEDGKWYSTYVEEGSAENVEADGILGALADLTVESMTDNEQLTAKIKTLEVADALGYTLGEDGKWYDNGTEVTGIMAVIAGAELNNIQDSVDGAYMGDILSYNPVDVVLRDELTNEISGTEIRWCDGGEMSFASDEAGLAAGYSKLEVPIYAEDGTTIIATEYKWYKEPHVLMQAVARKQFDELDTLTEDLTVADFIPEEDRQKGLMKLVDPNTTLDGMTEEMTDVMNTTTMGELIECEAIKLDGMSETQIDYFVATLGGLTLPGFVQWATNMVMSGS